jgi:hypothetical protein
LEGGAWWSLFVLGRRLCFWAWSRRGEAARPDEEGAVMGLPQRKLFVALLWPDKERLVCSEE